MSALRVLLVDDSPAFLKTAKQFLTDFCGAVVVGCASSGEEAIETVEELSPQLVLMDLVMEGIGGLEAAQRIKRRDNAPPVVLVSLNACAEYRNIADSLGIDGFVSKTEFTVQIPRLLENLSDAGSGNYADRLSVAPRAHGPLNPSIDTVRRAASPSGLPGPAVPH